MYKVDPPVDKLDLATERRRTAEAARKIRIFNTRSRVMGLEINTLDQQVEENQRRQDAERQRDKAFDDLRSSHDKVLLAQEQGEEERRSAIHSDLARYWATHQRVEDSRDADLKCNLKGASKFITISESELGPASMQVFMGEDVEANQRRKDQIETVERDLQAQKEDAEKRRMREKHKEQLIGKKLEHQDRKAVRLDALEEECRKALRIGLDNYNHALAAEQAETLRAQCRKEERDGVAEMWHMVNSDLLTECPEAAEKGSGRVLTDRWKGMTPQQLTVIYKEREEQRLQRQKQRETEKAMEAAWDLQCMSLGREVEEEERRETELQRELNILLDQHNQKLAKEQQAHQEYLNKQLYTNEPKADYFNQFNTTSR